MQQQNSESEDSGAEKTPERDQSPASVNGSPARALNGGDVPVVNGGENIDEVKSAADTNEINGENIKSPPSSKVKKQKSFKKALMKKLGKKEEKEK